MIFEGSGDVLSHESQTSTDISFPGRRGPVWLWGHGDILRFRVTAPDGWDVRGKPCSIWKVLQHSHLSLETKVIQFLPALDSRSFWIHPEWPSLSHGVITTPWGSFSTEATRPEPTSGTRAKVPCLACIEGPLSRCHPARGLSLSSIYQGSSHLNSCRLQGRGGLCGAHLPGPALPTTEHRHPAGLRQGHPPARPSTGNHRLPRDSYTAPRDRDVARGVCRRPDTNSRSGPA